MEATSLNIRRATSGRLPKVIPENIKARIVELLQAGSKGDAIVAIVAFEFAGYKISAGTISLVRARAGLGLAQGGRRPGELYSAHRARAAELRAAGLTLTAISAELGISKQAVSKLLKTDG